MIWIDEQEGSPALLRATNAGVRGFNLMPHDCDDENVVFFASKGALLNWFAKLTELMKEDPENAQEFEEYVKENGLGW